MMEKEEIKKILPHREPLLLVDRVTELQLPDRIEAEVDIQKDWQIFQGHFPEFAVMPGVLIVEALAQVGAVAILSVPENKGKLALFGAIKNARFKKQVRPGDQLELRCALTAQHGSVGFGSAEALVDGEVACKAELTFALADNDKACEN